MQMTKTFIIAEAGVNHNGSTELAKKLIDVAVDAGVDYVKFQTFKADKLVSKLAKFIFCIPNISEVVVLVIVKIDNLKDFSKSILSTIKTPDKINKLIKNEINIRKEIFTNE